MYRRGNAIRGPTGERKTNDRAGNAAVRPNDRGGSGTDQPGRLSRYRVLAPVLSVGGAVAFVKFGGGVAHADACWRVPEAARAAREQWNERTEQTGAAGKRAGRRLSRSGLRGESGTAPHE